MKLLNRLTLKHLFMNKKRTIVTIIGIILSTSLMVGIGLLMSTFLYSMQQDAISYNGSHHAYFDSLTKEEKETLDLNINLKDTYSYGVIGYSNIKSENDYKPYLYLVSGEAKLLEKNELIEGTFPKTKDEIVLPEHLSTNGGVEYKIGDKITLDIGPRIIEEEEVYNNNISFVSTYEENNIIPLEKVIPKKKKTYTIVGIIRRSKLEDYSAPGYMAFTTNEEDVVQYRTYGEYKDVKKSYELTNEICESLNDLATCEVNSSLLYYYGISKYDNVNRTIISVLIISLTLLSIGCIIVIYNSFAISTMERKKSFGLYSSLGASPKQIKYTVFFEAFLVGGIGIFLGVLSAFLGIYVTIEVINFLIKDFWKMTFQFVVEPSYVIIPIIFMIVVVYLSAFIPAKRSSKVSSIEMIRENDEIKIPRKKVKTPKWIHKIFGMEGEIALKNMKRNKRKYRITLLSIFISIVLFISFSTYVTLGLSITKIEDLPDYDIYVSTDDEQIIEEIISRDNITSYYKSSMKPMYLKMQEKEIYQKDFYRYYEAMFNKEEQLSLITIVKLEQKDFEKISKDKKPIFYNKLNFVFYENNSRKSYFTKIIEKETNELTLCNMQNDNCKNISITMKEELPDIMKELPIDNSQIILLISDEMAKEEELFKMEKETKYLTIRTEDYKKLYEEIDKKYGKKNNFFTFSPKIELESEKNGIIAIKILLYGFITLVTLTGVTSVFNTIHTSIHLRRKEFAMLRSIGLSPKGFNKMIFFESLFFGLKSLFFALPVSGIFIYLINLTIGDTFLFGKIIIPWDAIFLSILGVFLIVILTMWYSVRKIKKENILDSLRDENI